ncbi:GFA family protein [Geminicoccus roseus]|uniref:GFA family protein n=1 Tax=Geminicoccus roseus TaxID=404900 RepID=UPI0004860AEC|nr:GFA family protein [Geminicoccus roseus]
MDQDKHTGLRTGGCQCGQIRYALTAPVVDLYVCHCRQCRRQSASAFGISVILPADGVRLLQGIPASWSRPTSTGDTLECAFCPTCGSRLWHRSARDGTFSVKGGSLDEPVDLTTASHIWTAEKLPGVILPERAACFDGEPPAPSLK